jgi:cation diffusion facilitator CzcD-associated flavoprotein CzcO
MQVAIMGAGFGGIGLGIQLKRAGIDSFTILEKAFGVGGTWRDNTYPGLTCDVPSHLYSFSFEPNPEWSRRFPPQPEILAYLERCVEKYGLTPHIRLGTEVASAGFDPERGRWLIRTADGEELEAEVLVSATGQLSRPTYPTIPGLESFGGHFFHSARWDHDYELAGKRVGVIGTGATAAQFVPEIAPRVARLDLFQRSAPWVVRKRDRAYPRRVQDLHRSHPRLQKLSRWFFYWAFETRVLGFTRRRWLLRPYEMAYRRRLRKAFPDAALRSRLLPDYPIGCKRIVLSSDYPEALGRANVDVVTEAIREITPRGVATEDGAERELDALILATGFQANDFLAPMRITGLDARELNDVWRRGAEAYLGISVAGFPNLFILYGPNTNLGAGSIIYMLESQIRFVIEALGELRRTGARYLEVRDEAQRSFNAEIGELSAGSVWQAGCRSWYVTETGRNTNNWPGLTFEYRRRTRRPDLADFRLVGAA